MEKWIVLIGALVLGSYMAVRLSQLKPTNPLRDAWPWIEAFGCMLVMVGCTAAASEWWERIFDVHGETMLISGGAIFGFGVSRMKCWQFVARLSGWEGEERRSREA